MNHPEGNPAAMPADTVLITGASGMLGSGIATRLRAEGVPVVATDRTPAGSDVVACDVTDAATIERLVEDHGVTSIVHCGAFSGPMVARDQPRSIVEVNIGGTANLLEIARRRRMRRMVFCSSLTVYGSTADGPVPETTATAPTSVYGASKVAGEALVRAYAAQHGLDGVALRIGTVYGPGRRTACFVRSILENAERREPTTVPFGRDFPRQYLYVEDAIDALYRAWSVPSVGHRVLNVTGPDHLSAGEVAGTAARVVPGVEVRFGSGPDPDDPDRQGPLCPELAAAELGYRASWTLADGIKAYAAALGHHEPRQDGRNDG
jgi:UDP-glucuronate 4-epimerase